MNGTQEEARSNALLRDYYNSRAGFMEIANKVFGANSLEAYSYLTNRIDCKFRTLPNRIVAPYSNKSDNLAIDFCTLFLFYSLEKELGFNFEDKFIISRYIILELENEISTIENSPESEMRLIIKMSGVRRVQIPKEYNSNRIKFIKSILDWIEKNCVIDKVEEKLETLTKIGSEEEGFDASIMRMLVDYMYLSKRENTRFITSDSTYLTFSIKSNIYHNLLNPEQYLVETFGNKCDTSFYRFLLNSNYLGIKIDYDTLKVEFFDFLVGKQNQYALALENIQFFNHGDASIIETATRFIKDIYLTSSISLDDKNRHSFDVLRNTFYGMPTQIASKFHESIKREFRLLGDYYDNVLIQFDLAWKIFSKK
jgi:hypothetical protein